MSKNKKKTSSRRRQSLPRSKNSRRSPLSRNFSGIIKSTSGRAEERKGSRGRHEGLSRAPSGAVGTSSMSKSRSLRTGPQASQKGLSVPFVPSHKVLLVGEGDFSFALSLFQHHKCRNLVATTFESNASLLEKHPQTAEYLKTLAPPPSSKLSSSSSSSAIQLPKLLYNIDATVLCHPSRGGGSALRRLGPFDRVVFNFPHVGGLTKDVNRQVRANQELCVKFLESASKKDLLAEGGRVVVTLFEGDPYELWGIRNLARHVGLAVVRSSRFEWEQYPGYKHARTLGNVKSKHGGEAKSAWKGEERRARMYIFGRPDEEDKSDKSSRKKRKRRNSDGSSSSDENSFYDDSEEGDEGEEQAENSEEGEDGDEQVAETASAGLNNTDHEAPGPGSDAWHDEPFEGFTDSNASS